MDEAHFRAARSAVVARPCVFEKALLAGCAGCELAVRHALAEREAIACDSPAARANCEALCALVRERATFPLKLPPSGARLPHAVTMRLACGGIRGVAQSVGRNAESVHRLLEDAQARYGSFPDLPWPAIVQSILGWQGRRRHGAGNAR